jgi:uncharacterized protein (DUF1697 family)
MCYTPTYGTTDVVARTQDNPAPERVAAPVEAPMTEIKVLLLRGVNVAGANRLPMPEFRQMLLEQGLTQIHTHIQSGNAVFLDTGVTDVEAKITAAMKDRFGFAPTMFLMGLAAYDAILAANPYHQHGLAEGTKVHFFFLGQPLPAADHAALMALAGPGESVKITDAVIYLNAPNGIGRSALANKLGQSLKTPVTERNQSSAMAIAALARTITV